MSKRKQRRTKRANMDTPLDTSDKDYEINLDYYKKEYCESQRRKRKPLNLSKLSADVEVEVHLVPRYASEIYNLYRTDENGDDQLLDVVDELASRLINNQKSFIDLVRKKPSLIFNDFVVQYTIRKLQRQCNPDYTYSDTEKDGESGKKAQKLLNEIGVPVFIPSNSPSTSFPQGALYRWKADPNELVTLVILTREAIKEYFGSEYRNLRDEMKAYERAYEHIYQKKFPQSLNRVIKAHRHTITYIAIAFVADEHRASPQSTISFWKSDLDKTTREKAFEKSR